jgi:hypothetical protein
LRGCHAGDDAEWDEQSVLGAEYELADAREPPDPCLLTKGMLLDVLRGVGAGSVVVLSIAVSGRRAISTVARFIGCERSGLRLRRAIPGQVQAVLQLRRWGAIVIV